MDMRNKHAYLIMVHNNFNQLQTLIQLLDDDRNDIYLHIDKKASPPDCFRTSHSRLILIDRIRVSWGGYSMIQCELNLLKAAAPGHYQYYHLLSGVDLPLKSQDEIHRFFDENNGKEFISFDKVANETRCFYSRVQYWNPFQDYLCVSNRILRYVFYIAKKIIFDVQRASHYSRKIALPLYKGATWFSITDGLAHYIVEQEAFIRKQFSSTTCADEVFLQTLAMSSPFSDKITGISLRAIDWTRGHGAHPYTYHAEDVPALLARTDAFWARKFDEHVDAEAIHLVAAHLKNDEICSSMSH